MTNMYTLETDCGNALLVERNGEWVELDGTTLDFIGINMEDGFVADAELADSIFDTFNLTDDVPEWKGKSVEDVVADMKGLWCITRVPLVVEHLMNGYVKFDDGSYGRKYSNTTYIRVHEDEADAQNPELYVDEEDTVTNYYNEFYSMYSGCNYSPYLLTRKVRNADIIMDKIYVKDPDEYSKYLDMLLMDIVSDISTLARDGDPVHIKKDRAHMNDLMRTWLDLMAMEGWD